jgi:hypothetical protein
VAQGECELQIHGWVFQPEDHLKTAKLMGRLMGISSKELTAEEKKIFQERSKYFLDDNERKRTLSISLAGEIHKLSPSAGSGHFNSTLRISSEIAQKLRVSATNGVAFSMMVGGRAEPAPYSAIHFLDEVGVSVISDIDDTIKISEVLKKKELLRNTFCRPFKPVPGMPEVYQGWQKTRGVEFHYVSAMPWQLYLPIREFIVSNSFPNGVWECRVFRFTGSGLMNLLGSPAKYKQQTIQKLVAQFPKRQFVFVGDSGEEDPEVYGAVARKFPEQIKQIYIRDVTGDKADSKRYGKAFDKVAPEKWRLFKEAKELPVKLE